MADISLTASMRSNLLSLQQTQSLMDTTQERLSKYNLKGKTIHPFVTHEGSGLSGVQRLKKVTGANVTPGLAIYGHVAQNERDKAQKEVDKWVK